MHIYLRPCIVRLENPLPTGLGCTVIRPGWAAMHEGLKSARPSPSFYLRLFFVFSHLLTRIISSSSKIDPLLINMNSISSRREIYQIGVKDGRRLSFSNLKISVELCLLVMVIIILRTHNRPLHHPVWLSLMGEHSGALSDNPHGREIGFF